MAPQNYVQQLASALGLNNTNMATTDFESLIEMNRRQQEQQLNVSFVKIDINFKFAKARIIAVCHFSF